VATEGPKIDPNATPAGLFDHGAPGPNKGQLNLPRGIAQDASGNFFVADTQNLRIEKFDKDGKFLAMFGSKGNGDGQFSPISDEGVGTGPGGIAVDKAGNVYVADTWNHRIQKFDNNGKFLAKWGSFLSLADPSAPNDAEANNKLYGPRGTAIGPDGNLYVTDTGNKRVVVYDTSGKFVRKIDSGMSPTKKAPDYPFSKPGEMNEPIGIAVDAAGNVYVADVNNHRIQKFDKDGKPVAQWPVPDKDWAPGPYLEPFLALDGAGNLYATAPSGKTVLKYDKDGKMVGEKNKEGTYTVQLPTGIWATKDAVVYVVDTNGNTVVNFGKVP
jgi:sugar lactone lactonase YvrE